MLAVAESRKNIPCPVCGKMEERVCKERLKGTYRIVKCQQCGLTYTNPMPIEGSNDSFHEVYNGWDYHDIFRNDPAKALQMARNEVQLQTKFWKSRGLLMEKPGRFLDVGCGAGHILAAAKKDGWDAIGLEIDREAFKNTAKLWKLDIRSVFLADAGLSDNYFDWIRARYVFEHLPQPGSVLQEIYRVLKPGGILTIDVPNQGGFSSLVRIFLGKEQGLGQIYGYLDPPIHVIGYSPRTMKFLLEKNGFEVPFSFTTYPGSPRWRPECAPKGIIRWPYITVHWILSLAGIGSICVACGRKPLD